MNVRIAAVQVLSEVIFQHYSLSAVLPNVASKLNNPADQALLQQFSYGSLRWYHRLQAITEQLLLRPLPAKEKEIFCLLILGLYQILYTRIPDHAAVSETVNAAKKINKLWAVGLLNKTLRRFLREQDDILKNIDKNLQAQCSHPQWLIKLLQQSWPEQWQTIIEASNHQAPMFIRVNQQKISRDVYLKLLLDQGIQAQVVDSLPHGILLAEPIAVPMLPGFNQGLCSVQDASGQQVISLLDLKNGLRVLDACAAPGSKTSYILETNRHLAQLTAVDCDMLRLNKIKENIDRLQLDHHTTHLVLSDATHVKEWWDGKQFDRILIDAPCSATGVIRRHPDIKILKRYEDINQLAQQQLHLLNCLWPLLKKDGLLVYSTCSVLPQENEKILADFFEKNKDAKIKSFSLKNSISLKYGVQFLPEINGGDGFYISLIVH